MYNLGTHVSSHTLTHQHITKCMPHTETHILTHRLTYGHTGTHSRHPSAHHTCALICRLTYICTHTGTHASTQTHKQQTHKCTHKTQTHAPNSLTYIFSSYMGSVCPAKESSFLPGQTSWSLFFQRCSLTQKGLRKMWKGFGFGFLGCLLPREDCRTQGWAG